ncbi:MAG TPA: hypothetical protein VH370_12215 [Humisphaera sp.]|jgi:hypothetical protein|nr:hypothetical protein [Humisphaera sp.]
MTTSINEFAAWFGILAGVLSGSIAGLRFNEEHWLGGYGSWRRRLMRLGHISFFGIALLNLSLALTVRGLHWPAPPFPCAVAMAAAIVLMPAICFLSAWRRLLRHLFVLPVGCVLAGVIGLLWRRVMS